MKNLLSSFVRFTRRRSPKLVDVKMFHTRVMSNSFSSLFLLESPEPLRRSLLHTTKVSEPPEDKHLFQSLLHSSICIPLISRNDDRTSDRVLFFAYCYVYAIELHSKEGSLFHFVCSRTRFSFSETASEPRFGVLTVTVQRRKLAPVDLVARPTA